MTPAECPGTNWRVLHERNEVHKRSFAGAGGLEDARRFLDQLQGAASTITENRRLTRRSEVRRSVAEPWMVQSWMLRASLVAQEAPASLGVGVPRRSKRMEGDTCVYEIFVRGSNSFSLVLLRRSRDPGGSMSVRMTRSATGTVCPPSTNVVLHEQTMSR